MHRTQDGRNWIADARSRLALRRAEKPTTKAGQIRALWPDIEAALEVGQSMKTICAWLAEDAGISLGVTSLTSYISRTPATGSQDSVKSSNRWIGSRRIEIQGRQVRFVYNIGFGADQPLT